MYKMIVACIGVAAFLIAAAALRHDEAPYIAYMEGQRTAATDGLKRKAGHGDGFAALLVAQNYSHGVMGAVDIEKASDWYLAAARSGEIRAIVPFVGLALTQASATPDRCEISMSLLDLVGRAGELAALLALGRYYETGLCVETDLAMATRYYMSAGLIDGRFREWADAIEGRIGTGTASELTPRVETFDVTRSVALAQFLAAAPALR